MSVGYIHVHVDTKEEQGTNWRGYSGGDRCPGCQGTAVHLMTSLTPIGPVIVFL